jgi:nitroreductase
VEFFDVVERRCSIRLYGPQPLESDQLQHVLAATNRAPSAGNLQAFEIYLIRDAKCRAAVSLAAGDQEFLAQAPILLVFCAHAARSAAKYGKRGADLYAIQDATIACTYAMLAATAMGLSTVWVGAFDEDKVRRAIGAPSGHRPVAMLPVGVAAEHPTRSPRRELKDLIHEVGHAD